MATSCYCMFVIVGPGLVSGISVTPYSTSLQLSWSAPLLPNGIITAYQVTHYLSGSGIEAERVEQNTTDISTTLTLTGLRPQTSYTVTVRAYTIAGAGEETSVVGTTEAVRKFRKYRFHYCFSGVNTFLNIQPKFRECGLQYSMTQLWQCYGAHLACQKSLPT